MKVIPGGGGGIPTTTDSSGNPAAKTVTEILSSAADHAADEFLETSFTIDGSETVAYTLEVTGMGAYTGCLMTATQPVAGDGTILRLKGTINAQGGTVFAGQPIASGEALNSFLPGTTYRIPLGTNTVQFKAESVVGAAQTSGSWIVNCIFHKNPGYFYLG